MGQEPGGKEDIASFCQKKLRSHFSANYENRRKREKINMRYMNG